MLSVSLMAHPQRAHYIPALQEVLGDVPIAWSGAKVKRGRVLERDVWDTGRRAMSMFDPEARFHLVVQDDAVLGRDFYPRLKKVLSHGESYAYCLYFRFKSRATHAEFNDAAKAGKRKGYFTFQRLQFGVGIVMPTAIIPDMLAFCEDVDTPHYDLRMGAYLDHIGMETLYPLPSLVNHRPNGRSLVGHGGRRVAQWFE